MIIVNQDKEKIINFDNVKVLIVKDNEIAINFENEMMMRIATYATEARAKQVLEDIHRVYGLSELYKYTTEDAREEIIKGLDSVNQFPFKYIMPKE